MHILWGILIAAFGVFLFISARTKSTFIIYKLLEARSRLLWRNNVHIFHQVAGIISIIFGILVALKII